MNCQTALSALDKAVATDLGCPLGAKALLLMTDHAALRKDGAVCDITSILVLTDDSGEATAMQQCRERRHNQGGKVS